MDGRGRAWSMETGRQATTEYGRDPAHLEGLAPTGFGNLKIPSQLDVCMGGIRAGYIVPEVTMFVVCGPNVPLPLPMMPCVYVRAPLLPPSFRAAQVASVDRA